MKSKSTSISLLFSLHSWPRVPNPLFYEDSLLPQYCLPPFQIVSNPYPQIGYSRKKSKQGGWVHGISMGIEEIACGNSRGYLIEKEVEFPGLIKKN